MKNKLTTKGLLRYPGGKSRAVKILNDFIPPEVTSVRAPFFGGGSFELYLTQRGISITGYDYFRQLTTFWEQVINDPVKVADQVSPHLGNVDKVMFKELQTSLKEESLDDIDMAAAFFIVNRCSFSGATLSGGYSSSAASGRFTDSSVERLRRFHNPLISVQYGDAFDEIFRGEEDFLFLDPPYALESPSLYGVNGSHHQDFDHERLRDVVVQSGREFLLTYNNSEYIRDLWSGYPQVETSWSYGMNSTKESSELIIHS